MIFTIKQQSCIKKRLNKPLFNISFLNYQIINLIILSILIVRQLNEKNCLQIKKSIVRLCMNTKCERIKNKNCKNKE